MSDTQKHPKQHNYKPIYSAIIIPITLLLFGIMVLFINYNRKAVLKDFPITETFDEATLCITYNIKSDINVKNLVFEFTFYDENHIASATIEKEVGTLKTDQTTSINIQLPKDTSISFTENHIPEYSVEIKRGKRTFN